MQGCDEMLRYVMNVELNSQVASFMIARNPE